MSSKPIWPAEPDGRPVAPVAVMASVGKLEADMKAALLEAYDIPVQVVQSALQDRFSSSVFGNYLMQTDLLVPEDRGEEALALLSSEGESEEEEPLE